MNWVNLNSVRKKLLAAFLGLFSLVILVLGISSVTQIIEQTKSDYEFSVSQQLKLVDNSIYHYVKNIANNTRMLSELPLIKQADSRITSYIRLKGPDGKVPMEPYKGSSYEIDVFEILESFQKSHPSVKNASLGVHENGGFIKAPPSSRFDGYDARTREWYKTAVNGLGKVVLSEIYTTSSGEKVIYSVSGVKNKLNQLVGVISLDIDLKDFSDMINGIQLGKRGFVILIDSKGQILAHPRDQSKIGDGIETLGIKGLTFTVLKGQRTFVEKINGKTYQIQTVASNIPYFPLYYIAMIEESEFYSSAVSLSEKIVVLSLFLALLTLWFAVWISRRLSEPIHQLSVAADQMTSGNLGIRLEMTRQDEIGDLADRFNKMAETLEQSQNHLESTVVLRTEELIKANQDLITVNSELKSTVGLLRETQTQLIRSEKLSGLGTLVAGVAHEINTPIGVAVTASSYVEDLTRELQDKYEAGVLTKNSMEQHLKKSIEAIAMVNRNLQRASDIVNQFKSVAVNQSVETRRTILLKSYIQEVLKTFETTASLMHLDIQLESNEDILIETYPGMIAQMLTILMENAMVHAFKPIVNIDDVSFETSRSHYIHLKLQCKSDSWQLVFEDNGVGMSEEILHRLFEPFFTTNRSEGAKGLGLHVVYNIVTLQLMGQINCESKPDRGSRFVINVPIE